MAYDLLTTSGINSLVTSYTSNEIQKRISPLQTKKTKYTNISNIYSSLLKKIDSLNNQLLALKATGSSSAFAVKTAKSSNTAVVTATASSGTTNSTFAIRVNQLAKNDMLVSYDKNSSDFSSITTPGTYSFVIKTGDGQGGQFTSNISLDLLSEDFVNGNLTFDSLAKKITNAINNDKAVVSSSLMSGSTISSGSFVIDLNGSTKTINYTAGTYEEVVDSIIMQLSDVSDISAEKITNGSDVQLKLTVADSSKYISIYGDTGSIVSELGIAINKEKAAAGFVSATSFSPSNGLTQISLTSKNSGAGFKIEEISDLSGNILNEFGLNLGTSRSLFVQNANGQDIAGYVYDASVLNSKIIFNGLNIERDSNNISDLVSGITFNLNSVMKAEDSDAIISVSNNVDSVRSKIEEFISSFNDVYTYLKTNTSSQNGIRAPLLGDTSASSILNMLSSIAYSPVSGLNPGTINSLSKMGITFNINTGLSISNSNQLNYALENDITEVEQSFNSELGIATNLYNKLLPYSGFNGYLTERKNSIDDNIKSITDSITKIQSKIDKDAEVLRNKFIQMQSQLNSLLTSTGYFGNDLFA